MIKAFFIGAIVGVIFGMITPRVLAKQKTYYKVGDCLSNGLYYEKVTGIKYSAVTHEAIYEFLPTVEGRLSNPSSFSAWFVHDTRSLVNNKNCL